MQIEQLSSESFWQEAWARHLESYLNAPPRLGHWIAARFPDKQLSVIEVGGGSCRDSRYLAERGYTAIGTDLDERVLNYLMKRFPASPLAVKRENAFSFTFVDKSFDISFSNGFWGCFGEEQQLHALAREQARITKRFLIVVAHNAANKALEGEFRRLAGEDPLYAVRFFDRKALSAVLASSGVRYRRLRFAKFGGLMDRFYGPRIKGLPNVLRSAAHHVVPRLYPLQAWGRTERIVCIVELQ